jgi:hypoxanthine-DNA glycosylase
MMLPPLPAPADAAAIPGAPAPSACSPDAGHGNAGGAAVPAKPAAPAEPVQPAHATEPDELRKRCFAPVVDADTRLLILGSLPGERSLALQEYYGNRQNRFWMLVSAVLGEDLLVLPYQARLARLRHHGVGLWDVVAEARRDGSLDSNIRARADNDLPALLAAHPAIHTIAFNGGTAARLGRKLLGESAARYRVIDLPSSSPAYTVAYADKLGQWMRLRA